MKIPSFFAQRQNLWPDSLWNSLLSHKNTDSKTLNDEKRDHLFKKIRDSDSIGWIVNVLSASELSASMLQTLVLSFLVQRNRYWPLIQEQVQLKCNFARYRSGFNSESIGFRCQHSTGITVRIFRMGTKLKGAKSAGVCWYSRWFRSLWGEALQIVPVYSVLCKKESGQLVSYSQRRKHMC